MIFMQRLFWMFLVAGMVSQAHAQEAATETTPAEQTTAPAAEPATVAEPAASAPAPAPLPAAPAAPVTQEADTEEIPAPKRSLLKTAATKEFNKAIYFDQVDNGLVLPPLELEYDITVDQGKSLKVGNILFNEKTFSFALQPLEKLHPQLKSVAGSEGSKYALVMAWPEKLFNYGSLEMISRTGKVLWKYNFTEADRKKWSERLDGYRKELLAKGVPATEIGRKGIFGTQFGIVDLESAQAPFWKQRESFRFCLVSEEGRSQTKLCSQRYGSKSNANSVVMGKIKSEAVQARVLVQSEAAPLANSVPVAVDMPTSFYAELAGGESYEFIAMPNKLQLMDISDTVKPNLLRIVGYETRPVGKSIILNPDQYNTFTKAIGFESTIGDPRKFWASAIKKDDPKIYLPGQGGGIFKQKFDLSEVPRAQARIYLQRQTPKGTYIDGVELEARKQPSAGVSSSENKVIVDKNDPAYFTWEFKADKRGEINRSYLDVDFGGKKYRSYYEIYKGYPRELSGRFIAVQAANSFIMLGEVAYNQWFESLLGWDNYWVGRQRWGVSAKYFQSFNNLKVNSAGDTAPLSVMTIDGKYRLTPGLWGRDETVGPLVSYQNVTFDELKAPMLGVGAFWARSMPRVFDNLLNYIPLMKYPKWVDMEFIYYVSSMKSDVKLDSSMSLNFHGKVLWTQSFFGEAGFGVKRYAYTDQSLNQKAELNTFYGTVGLGINF
jgi:3-oxoacyl-[acyl-carrier protein] reductase